MFKPLKIIITLNHTAMNSRFRIFLLGPNTPPFRSLFEAVLKVSVYEGPELYGRGFLAALNLSKLFTLTTILTLWRSRSHLGSNLLTDMLRMHHNVFISLLFSWMPQRQQLPYDFTTPGRWSWSWTSKTASGNGKTIA